MIAEVTWWRKCSLYFCSSWKNAFQCRFKIVSSRTTVFKKKKCFYIGGDPFWPIIWICSYSWTDISNCSNVTNSSFQHKIRRNRDVSRGFCSGLSNHMKFDNLFRHLVTTWNIKVVSDVIRLAFLLQNFSTVAFQISSMLLKSATRMSSLSRIFTSFSTQ